MDQHSLTVQLAAEDVVRLSLSDYPWFDPTPQKILEPRTTRRMQHVGTIFPHSSESICVDRDDASLTTRERTLSAAEEIVVKYRSLQAASEESALELEDADADLAPARPRPRAEKRLPVPPMHRWSLTPSGDTESSGRASGTNASAANTGRESSILFSSCNRRHTRMRGSTVEAIEEAAVEAQNIVNEATFRGTEIKCNRLGCTQVLKDQKALKYHIHIHKVHESMVTCPSCTHEFENRREFTMHRCSGPDRPERPLSPTGRVLRRVFSSLCCTPDTGLEQ